MSMIEIQSTRNQGQQPASILARQREDLENTGLENKSSTPVYVGMMLLALGLYLKNSLVGKSYANIPPEDSANPEDEGVINEAPLTKLASFVRGQNDFNDSSGQEEQQAAKMGDASPPFSHLIPIEPLHYNLKFFQSGAETNFKQPNFKRPDFPGLHVNDNLPKVSLDQASLGNVVSPGEATGTNNDDDTEDDNGDVNPTPANRRPQVSGPVVLHDQFACIMLMFALSDLLRGATDPDGDVLNVKNIHVSNGDLELVDGSYHFHSEDVGPVTVTYEITDGKLSTVQTASFNVLAKPPILGSDGADVLIGTNCDDEIIAKDGDDQIDGRAGDDTIDGGDGDDHIVGDAGNDVIWGGAGNDIIFGNAGDDLLFGGAGNDRLFGGEGNDVIDAGDGNDVIFGDAGNDVVDGGNGNDQISDGDGQDRVDGGTGNDTIVASSDATSDSFIGGEGFDTLNYSAAQSGLVVDLVASEVSSTETGVDQFASIESISGGSGDDLFKVAGVGGHVFVDDDAIMGEGCEDEAELNYAQSYVLDGGSGSDTLDYSENSDELVINIVDGVVNSSIDTNTHFSNFEVFVGGDGDDLFIVGAGVASLDGRGGNDTFRFIDTDTEENSAHQIQNFEIGDRINISNYDIFDREQGDDEQSLERVFNSEGPEYSETLDHAFPIRVRNQDSENDRFMTFIDVDFDGDEAFDMFIEIEGHHHLIINTHSVT